ncbi:MAG: fatty acyl-AMP ligase, partial [Acidobacteriota bacterium]
MVDTCATVESSKLSKTLVDLLRSRAASTPDRVLYTFLEDGEGDESSLTYADVDRRARAIAVDLRAALGPGDRVLLLYPPGLDYVAAFFGCLYAGVVAVPVYLPRPNRPMTRLRAVVADCGATAVLATSAVRQSLGRRVDGDAELEALRWVLTDGVDEGAPDAWNAPEIDGESLAFLQYTSGSTGNPKGVMLTHANLLHNLAMITDCFGQDAESVAVIWLPPYHDMGLIGGILQPLYGGSRVVLMSPSAFFQRPARWLQAISRYRATTSGGPNFAYDLSLRKMAPEQRSALDLSAWTVAFNGAEPVSAATLDAFAEGFADAGFERRAFRPCYGLAEGTLIVSGDAVGDGPVSASFERAALLEGDVAPASSDAEGDVQRLAGSGAVLGGQDLRIVDAATGRPCAPGRVGEIWVSSPSIAQGYWGDASKSRESLQARIDGDPQAGPFLRTGDLGFVHGGELFVTGRLKDLIIVRGKNFYPQDIERTVADCHPDFLQGGGAAFSVDVDGVEQVVVVQELERRAIRRFDAAPAADAARAAVALEHELQLHTLVFIRTGSLPKTSSGKVQRRIASRDEVEVTPVDVEVHDAADWGEARLADL